MKALRWSIAASAAFACVMVPAHADAPSNSADSAAVLDPAAVAKAVAAHKASRLGGNLLELSAVLASRPAMTTGQLLAAFPGLPLSAGVGNASMVTLDLVAKRDARALGAALEALGAGKVSIYGRVVSARMPVSALTAMDRMPELLEARPALSITNRGAFVSQGDYVLGGPQLRPPQLPNGATGAGVLVGVMSDSFGCLTTQPDASADLGTSEFDPVTVLREAPTCTGATDEGRAMVQVVADVAPGSRQSFYTASGGQADFANGIKALIDGGANVVVDDTRYFDEPSFQDGIVAQAADAAVARGVPFISSAGNFARLSYESDWRSGTGAAIGTGNTGPQFDFDPGANTVTRQTVSMPAGSRLRLALQWDEPFASISPGSPGSASDLDVYLVTSTGAVVAFSAANNIGGDPYEFLDFTNTTTATRLLALVIQVHSGPVPGRIKYVNYGSSTITFALPAASATALGHTAAAGALSVGAASFSLANACTGSTTVLELLSSRGGTAILRSPDGTRLASPVIRQKPDVVGPDGGNTSFYNALFNVTPAQRSIVQCQDQDGLANNFFGTSAAAAHIAGVTALLKQAAPFASPTQIYNAMRNTAEDMAATGVDFDSGYGFVRALQAEVAVIDVTPDDFSFTAVQNAASVTPVTSNTVTVSGITTRSRVIVNGDPTATYSINGGAFTNQPGLVSPGDTVTLGVTSAQAANATITVNVAVGSVIRSWTVQTGFDNSPDPFGFGTVTLGSGQLYTTPPVTITGVNFAVLVTVSGIPGVAYSINGAAFTTAAGRLSNGDSVRLQFTTPATAGNLTATLTVGVGSGTLTVLVPPDSTPDPIVFNNVTGAVPLLRVTSNTVTITGINVQVPVSLTGDGTAEYSVNGGAFTRAAGTLKSGDTVQLHVNAALALSGVVSASLVVGSGSGSWTVTTVGLGLGGLGK